MPRPFDYTFLKFDDNRFMREGRDGCRGVLEIIDGGIAVRPRRVHGAKRRVIIQHALLRFGAVIEDERSGNADPFIALHGAEFYFGVRGNLLCNAFAFARLNIQFAFKQMDGAERPHARLISFDGSKIVRFGGFQKFIDAIHGVFSSGFFFIIPRAQRKSKLPFLNINYRKDGAEKLPDAVTFTNSTKKLKKLIDFLRKVCCNKTKRRKSC